MFDLETDMIIRFYLFEHEFYFLRNANEIEILFVPFDPLPSPTVLHLSGRVQVPRSPTSQHINQSNNQPVYRGSYHKRVSHTFSFFTKYS